MSVQANMDGLLEWINTFGFISKPVESSNELSDGVILYQIMNEISPILFPMEGVKMDVSGNWVLKEQNLKRLVRSIQRYYEEVLHQGIVRLEQPNLSEAAKDNELEILKIIQLVLGCVVQCDDKVKYIEKITETSMDAQSALMVIIEKIMSSMTKLTSEQFGDFEDDPSKGDISRIVDEKMELIRENDKLQERLRLLEKENEMLHEEKGDLQRRLQDAELSRSKKKDEKAAIALRIETDELQDRITDLERKVEEREDTINSLNANLSDLAKKSDVLAKEAENAAKLKDQLDELKHFREQYEKVEASLEKYKKKADDVADLRRQLKQALEERDEAVQKYETFEESYTKNRTAGSLQRSLQDKNKELETKYEELLKEKEKLEADVNNLCLENQSMKDQQTSYVLRMQQLEDKIHDLQHGGSIMADHEESALASDLGSVMTAELKNKITALEREVEILRKAENKAVDTEQVAALNVAMESLRSEKAKMEQELKDATSKISQLESQAAKSNETIASLANQKAGSEDANILREKLKIAAARLVSLNDDNKKLTEQNVKFREFLKKNAASLNAGGGSSNENFAEAKADFENRLREKETEIEKLRKKIVQDHESYRREQKLMTSAWYHLGMQLQRKNADRSPASWLNNKRQQLDTARTSPSPARLARPPQ